jgi:hypothetical protein
MFCPGSVVPIRTVMNLLVSSSLSLVPVTGMPAMFSFQSNNLMRFKFKTLQKRNLFESVEYHSNLARNAIKIHEENLRIYNQQPVTTLFAVFTCKV